MNKSRKVTSDCVALIVAAGRGNRFGGELPKQYIKLDDMNSLARSLKIINSHPRIKYIRVVIHPDDINLYKESAKAIKLLKPVLGGEERQESVRLGLESFKRINPKYVLIHDAVRPFINHDTIDKLLSSLKDQCLAVVPAITVNDSLKRVKNNMIISTVDRKNLWQTQTPQVFKYQNIMKAHKAAVGLNLTDDAAIAEVNDITVKIIEGSTENFKITTPQDLETARRNIISERPNKNTRVGIGVDIHSFKPGKWIKLCGVKIPFNKSLKGHSDADVALHAITDAVLGAIGAGDIGLIFPPSESKWKNCASDIFLKYAHDEVLKNNGEILNIDLTIICEKPKINPYRNEMRERVAKVLKISLDKVNIKATTTERLGFTGREEGIAAQAIASVKL